ncbi:Hsp70 family protein [Corynebacterium variabile]|uniref:Hsp70 family protein n=1 Tax=Corynebacterium variabile TaxID=1727 RepID=UPI003F915224
MTWSLAVDLGTSNTVAAVQQGTSAPVALFFTGGATALPSMVYLTPGSVYVGDAAAEHADEEPVAFHPSPKRELTGAVSAAEAGSLVPVLAALFREVYRTATGLYGPEEPESVVLTHPEALSHLAQDILRTAAVTAGIPGATVALVPEPVAAAAYYCRGTDVPDRLLVIDIGGGTSDVALLEFSASGRPQLRAAAGDNGVGGRSFDHRMMMDIAGCLDGGVPESDTVIELGRSAAIRTIRAAREQLSVATVVDVELKDMGETLTYTRDHLVDVTSAELERIVTLVTRLLGSPDGDTGLPAVLTGGISLMPAVQNRIAALTQLRPVEAPHTAVALGALLVDQGAPATMGGSGGIGTGGTGDSADAGVRLRPGNPRRTMTIVGALLLVVLFVGGGLFLQGRGDSSTEENGTASGGGEVSADADDFDPSPVVPVRVAEDSPVLNGSVPGWLTCSALAKDVFDEMAGADNPHAVSPSNSVPGEIMKCSLNGSRLLGVGDITLTTRPPERFDAFQKYRSGNASMKLSTPLAEYPQWYRLTEEKTIGVNENSFVYIDGYGWLIISVSKQEDIDDRVADQIIRILTPLLGIVDH